MCSECPFRRDVRPTICAEKNSIPESFVGQAFGPFFLPCHKSKGFEDDACNPECRQCPGAATARTNWAVPGLGGSLLTLPADPVGVFATPAEFLAHHLGVSEAEAADYLKVCPPAVMTYMEMRRAGVRVVPLEKVVGAGGVAVTAPGS